jgi:hypothetical protein
MSGLACAPSIEREGAQVVGTVAVSQRLERLLAFVRRRATARARVSSWP